MDLLPIVFYESAFQFPQWELEQLQVIFWHMWFLVGA